MPDQTGPRTADGKARSSLNALKHGFTSEHLVIPGPLRGEFVELRAELIEEISPVGGLERMAFNRLLQAAWNQYRLMLSENEIFASDDDPLADEATCRQFDRIARYQARREREYEELRDKKAA